VNLGEASGREFAGNEGALSVVECQNVDFPLGVQALLEKIKRKNLQIH
jgi:hypothetical protein